MDSFDRISYYSLLPKNNVKSHHDEALYTNYWYNHHETSLAFETISLEERSLKPLIKFSTFGFSELKRTAHTEYCGSLKLLVHNILCWERAIRRYFVWALRLSLEKPNVKNFVSGSNDRVWEAVFLLHSARFVDFNYILLYHRTFWILGTFELLVHIRSNRSVA